MIALNIAIAEDILTRQKLEDKQFKCDLGKKSK